MIQAVLAVGAAVLSAAVLALISRRVMGVAVGWPRTFVVALTVWLLTANIATWVGDRVGLPRVKSGHLPADYPALQAVLVMGLVMAWLIAIGVGVLVVLEMLVPTGSLPGPMSFVMSLPGRRRRTRRYVQIMAICARHGLTRYLSGGAAGGESGSALARQVRSALSDGGVTFVKLGQMIATRPDVVGDSFARELSTLQSDAAELPWSQIEDAIHAELGRPVSDVFAHIDPEPLAAASVAQVHSATLLDGRAVVLKVQRPGAAAEVAADLDIIQRLARRLDAMAGWARRIGLMNLAQGFAQSLVEELDYTVEMANTRAIGQSAAGSPVVVPAILEDLSSRRLLVMERIDGVPLSRATRELAQLTDESRRQLATVLLDQVLDQVLVKGVFHADLHQGNIFLLPDNRLALLDFGSVGRLDSSMRSSLTMLLYAIQRQDTAMATDALLDVLDRPEHFDLRGFERDVGGFLQLQDAGRDSLGLFTALFALLLRHQLRVPTQVAAAVRALGALEGSLRTLQPGVDLMGLAAERGSRLRNAEFGPERVKARIEEQLVALLPMVQRLPRRIESITAQLEEGSLGVNVRVLADRRDRQFLESLMHRFVMSVLAAACGICGTLMILSTGGPQMLPQLPLFSFLGVLLLFVAFVLACRLLILIFQPVRSPV